MQTEETIGIIDSYPDNVQEFGYAVGTGIILISFFLIMMVMLGKWISSFINNTIMNSLNNIKKRLEKLEEGQEDMKECLNESNTTWKALFNFLREGRVNGNTDE